VQEGGSLLVSREQEGNDMAANATDMRREQYWVLQVSYWWEDQSSQIGMSLDGGE